MIERTRAARAIGQMVVLHAIWTDARLHLWGERLGAPGDGAGDDGFAVSAGALRSLLGDVYDSLLVSGAVVSGLTLRLPQVAGRALPSRGDASESGPPGPAATLGPCRVSTLTLGPADAVDLLAATDVRAGGAVAPGASLRYWSRAARLVLELLARQRFVPAVHYGGGASYRGYWQVVVDDEPTSRRLACLISSMPPVCRAVGDGGTAPEAADLVEQFLWTTVDALVRRCLEGDELVHAILDGSVEAPFGQMLWLRSVVSADAALGGSADQRREVFEAVGGWISKLTRAPDARTCRTCLKLEGPPPSALSAEGDAAPWTLSLHAEAQGNPGLRVDAASLVDGGEACDPRVLQRPFDRALEQVRADAARAARHVPALAPCASADGPVSCTLTLAEAYNFLRDAAPILELEGLGVWVPSWWRERRPRMRMWLDLRPPGGAEADDSAAMGLEALVEYDWRVAVGDEELSLEELRHLADSKQPLVRVRGKWTEVQPADLQSALSFVGRDRGGRITVFEALRKCYLADDRDTGLSVAGLRASGWVERLLGASPADRLLERVDPPAAFRGELRPYQRRGLAWLSFLTRLGLGACLADDMGLGKTIELIALLLHERGDGGGPGPTLLVVPMSLVGNWHRELARFGPSLRVMIHHGLERLSGSAFVDQVQRYDVVVSTYGLIHRDLEHLAAVDWHRVALDEAQNIKNPAAKQSKAIRALRAVHRVALTGTPVENRLSELWSIMDFLNEGYLGGAAEFRRRFAVPIERSGDTDRALRLRHLIRPFILRRLKDDPKVEVDLPEKMEMKVYCNLTREQAALYQALVDDMFGQIARSGGMQRRGLILATLVKLKQICNHPAQYLADSSELPHRSGKCDRLVEMLEEVLAEGDRALMFTQFKEMGSLLKKLLAETFDRDVLFLHGGTTRVQRDRIVDEFQSPRGDKPLLILSLKAGGYGLNLTAASHVFHYDRWWNPAVEDQATDRAHRIGQIHRVQVHKFVCIGTLEERIDALLEHKRDLADNIVGTGEQWLTELSTDKLREVFALSREAIADQ